MNLTGGGSTAAGGHGKALPLIRNSQANDAASGDAASDIRAASAARTVMGSPLPVKQTAVLTYLDASADAPLTISPPETTRRTSSTTSLDNTTAINADFGPPDSVLEQLERATDGVAADAQEQAITNTLVVSGGIAVAGSALLNTRAVYWFLSALLARPAVWRRFDPLDVIYAWERERQQLGKRSALDDADESLQSMVN